MRETAGMASLSISSRLPLNSIPGAREPRDIAAWTREACDKASLHRIRGGHHHNGDRARRLLRGTDRTTAYGHEHIHRQSG